MEIDDTHSPRSGRGAAEFPQFVWACTVVPILEAADLRDSKAVSELISVI